MDKRSSTTITEVLDGEYLAYGRYTIEGRAIPSAVDGFKPVQRKAVHTASRIWRKGDERPLRVFQLTGKMAAECAYHHGDASGSATIVGMAQSFKNSLPVFEEIGQFGSLRCPEAGAPRYISTRLTENFRLLYRDHELLEQRTEDGMDIEPRYFLPIVPAVLLNGSSGIAVGFATNIMNRDPAELVRCCLAVLDGRKYKDPLPWWRDFSGTVTKGEEGQWVMRGVWSRKDTSTVVVTELPPSMTYARYEAHLDSMVERGKISRYEDKSSGSPHYVVKFSRAVLGEMDDASLEKALKLVETATENFTCLDDRGRMREFSSAEEIVRWFVSFRLGYYSKRRERLLAESADKASELSNRARFITLILNRTLVVERRKRQELEAELASLGFAKRDGSFSYLVAMPIHSLTEETYNALLLEHQRVMAEMDAVKATTPAGTYAADLNELLRSLTKKR